MQDRTRWLSLTVALLLLGAGCDYREGLRCGRAADCFGLLCQQGICSADGTLAGGGTGGNGATGGGGSGGSGPLLQIDASSKLAHADAQHIYWHSDDQRNRLLQRAPIAAGAVPTTLGDVGETLFSVVVTKNLASEVFVYAGGNGIGKVTRWLPGAVAGGPPSAVWNTFGGVAANGTDLFWLQYVAASDTKRLVASDRSGNVTATLDDLQLHQSSFANLRGTSRGVCLSQDGGKPTYVPWSGGAVSLGGTNFELMHANSVNCVWVAPPSTVVVFGVTTPGTFSRFSVSFDVRAVVVIGSKLILLERNSGQLWAGTLSGSSLVAPRLPSGTTLRFTSLVASETRAFALAGNDVYEVVP